MQSLSIDATNKTPYFKLEAGGNFEFGGISMPEDAASFYFKILEWISDYAENPSNKTRIKVKFSYLNSTSSSMVFKFFDSLKRIKDVAKVNINCVWYYEEEDYHMLDYIEQIQEHVSNVEFDIRAVDEIKIQFSKDIAS